MANKKRLLGLTVTVLALLQSILAFAAVPNGGGISEFSPITALIVFIGLIVIGIIVRYSLKRKRGKEVRR